MGQGPGHGARFAVTGGREGWVRVTLTAVGVGLGVALLLFAAAVPTMVAARTEVANAIAANGFRDEPEPRPTARSIVAQADTDFRDVDIPGLVMEPEGDGAPHAAGRQRRSRRRARWSSPPR